MRRHFWSAAVVLVAMVIALGAARSLAAQEVTGVTNDQSRPIPGAGHHYIHQLAETVDPANGSVSLRLAVPVPPGRKLTLPFSFDYDSDIFVGSSSNGEGLEFATATPISSGGWSYSVPTLTDVYGTNTVPGGYTCKFITNYVFQAPDGSTHALHLGTEQPPQLGEACSGDEYYGVGGDDRYSAALLNCQSGDLFCAAVVAAANGTTFNFSTGPSYDAGNDVTVDLPGKIEDTNGNYVTISGSNTSPGQYQITDTAGRTAISSSGFGQTGNTVAVSGLATPYTITWSTVNADFALGDSSNFSNGSCFGFGNASTGGAEPVITEIALPDGQAFSFTYDPTYGLLSKVVYPGGGFVEYSWAVDSLSEDAQFTDSSGLQNGCNYHHGQVRLTERQVSFNGSTIALRQNFSYQTNWDPSNPEIWDTKTTTVTTDDLVRGLTYTTKYTYLPETLVSNSSASSSGSFSPQVPVEESTQYYGAQGELLKTVNESWAAPDLLASRQVVWPNTKTSERDFSYASAVLPELTEEDDYDFGAGGKGAEIRCREITYASFPTTPIYPAGPSIADRPASVATYDGSCVSGTLKAETEYAYDQTTPTGPTNIVEKDYSSGN